MMANRMGIIYVASEMMRYHFFVNNDLMGSVVTMTKGVNSIDVVAIEYTKIPFNKSITFVSYVGKSLVLHR